MVFNDIGSSSSSHWGWDKRKEMFTFKNNYGYYVPVVKTLQNFLQNPEVFHEISSQRHQNDCNLRDICDGYYVKDN